MNHCYTATVLLSVSNMFRAFFFVIVLTSKTRSPLLLKQYIMSPIPANYSAIFLLSIVPIHDVSFQICVEGESDAGTTNLPSGATQFCCLLNYKTVGLTFCIEHFRCSS